MENQGGEKEIKRSKTTDPFWLVLAIIGSLILYGNLYFFLTMFIGGMELFHLFWVIYPLLVISFIVAIVIIFSKFPNKRKLYSINVLLTIIILIAVVLLFY